MDGRHQMNEQGFSLLETLVTVSIFLLVLFAVYTVFESSQSVYAKGEGKVDVQQSARAAMDQIAVLLRNAGYFPENFTPIPPAILKANPIRIATNNALAIYGDADDTGSSKFFLFCLEGTRVRWVSSPAAVPACNGGMVLAQNVTNPNIFTYFDASNNPTADPAAVRRVVVTLTATEDVPGHQPQTYTLTSSVRLRNLK